MIGIYSAALTAGAALAAGVTVPLRDLVSGSWSVALALYGIPAILAALVWLPQLRAGSGAERGASAGVRRARISLWRDRRAWSVTFMMGLQSLLFYTVAAWLPDVFHAHGISSGTAGLLTSGAMVVGIPSALATSVLAARREDQRPLLVCVVGATAVGLLGVLIAPTALAPLWVVVLGLGQGAAFSLALTFTVLRSRDAAHASELAGMAQSFGYTLAALGPLLIGALHDASGGWALPLAVAVALTVPELIAGLGAAKPGFVGTPPDDPGAVSVDGRPERAAPRASAAPATGS